MPREPQYPHAPEPFAFFGDAKLIRPGAAGTNPPAVPNPTAPLRLVTSLVRFSESESLCAHRRVQQALAELKLNKPDAGAFNLSQMYTGEQLKEILHRFTNYRSGSRTTNCMVSAASSG